MKRRRLSDAFQQKEVIRHLKRLGLKPHQIEAHLQRRYTCPPPEDYRPNYLADIFRPKRKKRAGRGLSNREHNFEQEE